MGDKTKNERKNFCFITFEKGECAKQLLKAGSTNINGVELEVKKVTPKPDPRVMGMAFMGRGGGRGGFNGPYGHHYGDYYGYGYGDPYFAGGWGGRGREVLPGTNLTNKDLHTPNVAVIELNDDRHRLF